LNNFNHNTLTINDNRHVVNGKAYLTETYNTAREKGGKFDLSEVFAGDLQSASRKAVIKEDSYLEVEDKVVAANKAAKVRWTMVTPADAWIVDANTIKLKQQGRLKILTVVSDKAVAAKTWESQYPGTDYDATNPGTIMVGFESSVPAGGEATFTVTLKDGDLEAEPPLIKNDFLSGYNIGDFLEQGSYTSESESEETLQQFRQAWLAKYGNDPAAFSTKIIAPLSYSGYVESGKNTAFEAPKLASGDHRFGYSLTDRAEYNYGAYYLAFMVNVNSDLNINSASTLRAIIGTGTRYTFQYDIRGVMLGVTKGGAQSGKFRFGVGTRHNNANMTLSSGSYNFNETYLIVLKYDMETGEASLFVNPSIGETAPAPIASVTAANEDMLATAERGIRAIYVVQDPYKSEKIGGIRFANTWADAIGWDSSTSLAERLTVAGKRNIVSEIYYTASGVRVVNPAKDGIYIKKTLYENGVESNKILISK
jgi:hypothetical protein